MGRNKMLLDLHGEPLVRRTVRAALAGGCDPIIVVVGPNESDMRRALADLEVACVPNPTPDSPPGRSFQVGLEALSDADAAIMCLGDMVDQTAAMFQRLVQAGTDDRTSIVLSDFSGVVAPPHLVKRELFAEVGALDPAGVVQRLAQTHHENTMKVTWPRAFLADVDTPDDLESVRKRPS